MVLSRRTSACDYGIRRTLLTRIFLATSSEICLDSVPARFDLYRPFLGIAQSHTLRLFSRTLRREVGKSHPQSYMDNCVSIRTPASISRDAPSVGRIMHSLTPQTPGVREYIGFSSSLFQRMNKAQVRLAPDAKLPGFSARRRTAVNLKQPSLSCRACRADPLLDVRPMAVSPMLDHSYSIRGTSWAVGVRPRLL
jgi:hypothetical protein